MTTIASKRGDRTPSAIGYREAIDACSDIVAVLGTEVALDSFLHLVCDKACELLDIAHVSLYLRDEENGQFRGQVARFDRDVDAIIKRYVAGVPADAFTREILATRQPVLIRDAQTDPRPVRAQMRRWNVRAIFGVPMIFGEEVIGLLYFDNGPDPYPFTVAQQELAQVFANYAAVAVVQATGRSRLQADLTTISRQNRALKQLSAISDRLTSVVLEGGTGLADIAVAINQLTGGACAIHDAGFRRLAEAEDDVPIVSPLDDGIRDHPLLAEQLATLAEGRPATIAPQVAAGLPRRTIVAPILVSSQLTAYLVVEERAKPLGSLEMAVAHRATTVIALELVAARRGLEAGFDIGRTLLTELLGGDSAASVLSSRAARLGFDLRAPHVLAVVVARTPGTRPPAAQELAEAAAAASSLPGQGQPQILATELEQGVTMALRLQDGSEDPIGIAKRTLEQAVAGLASQEELLAGISSTCLAADDYRRAHFESTQIVNLLLDHSRPRGGGLLALTSDELGASRMLLASHGPDQLDAFLGDVLGKLLDPDDPQMTALLETVSHYLGSGSSTGRTAAALGLHENSVRNRLARVSELTGLDLVNDGEARLQLQLAVHGLQLRRELEVTESTGSP